MTTNESASMASETNPIMNGNGVPADRTSKLHGRAFYESIGSPQYVLAPMVDQSEFVPLTSTVDDRILITIIGLENVNPLLHALYLTSGSTRIFTHAPRSDVQRNLQIPRLAFPTTTLFSLYRPLLPSLLNIYPHLLSSKYSHWQT